jgi:hypothetical protein
MQAMGHIIRLFPKLEYFEMQHEGFIDGPTLVFKDLDKEFHTD